MAHLPPNGKLALSEQYTKHAAILSALRAAFEKVKHHKQYGKRVLDVFRAALPGYVVTNEGVGSSLEGLRVWGKELPYDQGLYMCWSASKPWQEGLAYDLDRQDPSDSLERMRDEEAIVSECEELERQIAALRARGRALVEALPVPKSAVTRREAHFWTSPSSSLAKRCPNLFDSEK